MNSSKTNRRNFLRLLAVGNLATLGILAGSKKLFAASVKENDPTAMALCFHLNTKKVDKSNAKCARYTAGQDCGSCQLFQGKKGAKSGPCTLFQNKIVPATGWCAGYAAKAK